MARKADTQQLDVYRWEEDFHEDIYGMEDPALLSLNECQSLVDQVCICWGVLPPKVEDGRGRKTACATPEIIRLPRSYREGISIIHEACHAVRYHFDNKGEAHDSKFVRLCIECYSSYFDRPREELEHTARSFGLEVSPSSHVPMISSKQQKRLLHLVHRIDHYRSGVELYCQRMGEEVAKLRETQETLRDQLRKIQDKVYG